MPSKKALKEKLYFFVDEAGDATFYNQYGRLIVGEEGCSKILLLGFIKTEHPGILRNAVLNLQKEITVNIMPQSPVGEPCLQIADYMNWAVQRAFVKGEDRYLKFVEDKITYLCDVYDFDKYPKNFYSKTNKFDITKMSPL
ncbi:MAG: hypothetical protein A3A33_01250 [Candidatus Yanofskybacteria bacterium RIFCSPLOWO2_01_FULL_49_25]|uniref:DUF3800 domain-containing protein n=1 Tax=Candidatus Yanofskybacteria bacterium RIFCSPLOWO2_01_FULL_49_25 TaxID=1802701 RepID=A0A1F8GWX9_9BACT|nr:MAG: hypothetical protein A3A33_01250 [Candidatus Yanofskybacteria bacterium RIFCSPLOWO2_01_FULL_49_25]